jgi:hypothetical protein
MDFDEGHVSFAKNGVCYGVAFSNLRGPVRLTLMRVTCIVSGTRDDLIFCPCGGCDCRFIQ